jgi:hypothetical protein
VLLITTPYTPVFYLLLTWIVIRFLNDSLSCNSIFLRTVYSVNTYLFALLYFLHFALRTVTLLPHITALLNINIYSPLKCISKPRMWTYFATLFITFCNNLKSKREILNNLQTTALQLSPFLRLVHINYLYNTLYTLTFAIYNKSNVMLMILFRGRWIHLLHRRSLYPRRILVFILSSPSWSGKWLLPKR